MITAHEAEIYLLALAHARQDPITNTRLNTMLYHAQGIHLQRTGKPLFGDEIQAWQCGPVVVSVYRAYEKYVREAIPSVPGGEDIVVHIGASHQEEAETLILAYGWCWRFSDGALVYLAQSDGSPWDQVYGSGDREVVITPEYLAAYTRQHPYVLPSLPHGESASAHCEES